MPCTSSSSVSLNGAPESTRGAGWQTSTLAAGISTTAAFESIGGRAGLALRAAWPRAMRITNTARTAKIPANTTKHTMRMRRAFADEDFFFAAPVVVVGLSVGLALVGLGEGAGVANVAGVGPTAMTTLWLEAASGSLKEPRSAAGSVNQSVHASALALAPTSAQQTAGLRASVWVGLSEFLWARVWA